MQPPRVCAGAAQEGPCPTHAARKVLGWEGAGRDRRAGRGQPAPHFKMGLPRCGARRGERREEAWSSKATGRLGAPCSASWGHPRGRGGLPQKRQSHTARRSRPWAPAWPGDRAQVTRLLGNLCWQHEQEVAPRCLGHSCCHTKRLRESAPALGRRGGGGSSLVGSCPALPFLEQPEMPPFPAPRPPDLGAAPQLTAPPRRGRSGP